MAIIKLAFFKALMFLAGASAKSTFAMLDVIYIKKDDEYVPATDEFSTLLNMFFKKNIVRLFVGV
jgi:hypothetical protein